MPQPDRLCGADGGGAGVGGGGGGFGGGGCGAAEGGNGVGEGGGGEGGGYPAASPVDERARKSSKSAKAAAGIDSASSSAMRGRHGACTARSRNSSISPPKNIR